MAIAKAITGNDIINGLATVNQGGKTATYDPLPPYSQHWASGDSLGVLQNINGRYLHHGGVSGSGNWEH